MVVEYASFILGASDIDEFEAWIRPLIAQCAAEDGCLAYDFTIERADPPRGRLFQAWDSQEAFDAHLVFPAHEELATARWGNRDVRLLRWTDAAGFEEILHRG